MSNHFCIRLYENSNSFLEFSRKVEKLVFEKADLITCVSWALKQQLTEQGVDEGKIIVTPNGVEQDQYSPDRSGKRIRDKYAISDQTLVIGFIGTFGRWHGT